VSGAKKATPRSVIHDPKSRKTQNSNASQGRDCMSESSYDKPIEAHRL
jgi:hypothetical protein